ncbi:hypothetical protein WJX74_009965 [Apatococcus lobatus]|uniref:Uncharacterized protein n=1 Tax=Apatococcus lobatus TaxID=904363 RepID=A0AAW1RQU6_9CHLO
MPWLLRGKRKSQEAVASGSNGKVQRVPQVEDVQEGVQGLSLEDGPAETPSAISDTEIFEDGAVHVALASPSADLDDVDVAAPSAIGMPGHTGAVLDPSAQSQQAADVVPEVSDSTEAADAEVPEGFGYLYGMSEEQLQQVLLSVQLALAWARPSLHELKLVMGVLRAAKPSMERLADEARARLLKLSQLQYKIIQYQTWKASLTPVPCFDRQVAGAAHHLQQELLSIMEATSMEAVEEALGELGCPGSLNMDCAIIRTWVEETANEHQQYNVELYTVESSLQEADKRESALQEQVHHLEVKLDVTNRLLLDLQVQSMVPVLRNSTL